MRNRLVALSAVVAFAVAVAAVAVVAGNAGDREGRLDKLSFALAGGGEASATGAFAAYPEFGPPEYRVGGELPRLGDEAPAYRLGSETTTAAVAELASELGLTGDVEETESGWRVRAGERELNVMRHPGLPWYLGRQCLDTPTSSDGEIAVAGSACVSTGIAVPAAEAPAMEAPAMEAPTTTTAPCPRGAACGSVSAPSRGVAQDLPYPAPPPRPAPIERPSDLPAKEEAERLARSFFTRLSVALDGFELQDGFAEWHARVQPRFDGLQTLGWDHAVSIGPRGEITGANGFLGEVERIGEYPLADTAKGLERLRSGARTGPHPGAGIMGGAPVSDDPKCAEPTVICDPPAPGTTVPPVGPAPATTLACPPNAECMSVAPEPALVPPATLVPPVPPTPTPPDRPPVLTITGVHLALQHVGSALVPVYVFELEGGGETFPVPAVTDEWIEQDQGRPEPAEVPTGVEGAARTKP